MRRLAHELVSAIVFAALGSAIAGCGSDESGAAGDLPTATPLVVPVAVTLDGQPEGFTEFGFIPGTSDILILERGGTLNRYTIDSSAVTATLAGSMTVQDVFVKQDCGLLSLAFDPGFEENRLFYVGHCTDDGLTNRIVRYTLQEELAATAATGVVILEVTVAESPRPWHNIGSMVFDARGHLWVVFGDFNVPATAQDLSSNAGKLLRIDPDRGQQGGYVAVDGNPFGSDIHALGLRSPWRAAFDGKGRLWIGDVGESTWEEINVVEDGGENFGWPACEGPCAKEGMTDPVLAWRREFVDGAIVPDPYTLEDPQAEGTGGRVAWVGVEYAAETDRYGGKLTGRMLWGDHCAGWMRAGRLDDTGGVAEDFYVGHLANYTGVAVGPDGYIYVSTFGSCDSFEPGSPAIFRLEPVSP